MRGRIAAAEVGSTEPHTHRRVVSETVDAAEPGTRHFVILHPWTRRLRKARDGVITRHQVPAFVGVGIDQMQKLIAAPPVSPGGAFLSAPFALIVGRRFARRTFATPVQPHGGDAAQEFAGCARCHPELVIGARLRRRFTGSGSAPPSQLASGIVMPAINN